MKDDNACEQWESDPIEVQGGGSTEGEERTDEI